MSTPIKPEQFKTRIVPADKPSAAEIIENVIMRGDLKELTEEQRTSYYLKLCESTGLNPLTQPFEYLILNGKLVLYARKACTEQLRMIHGISVTDVSVDRTGDLCVVIAKLSNTKGRTDSATGVVFTTGLKGDLLANAIMKAETKAKRRATLSICGLGLLDETEIDNATTATKEPLKSLAKKDARPMYSRMQAELYACKTIDQVKTWGVTVAERVKALPEDWQDILRLQYEESIQTMRQQEPVTPRHDTDGVIWEDDGERPMTPADTAAVNSRQIIGDFPPNVPRAHVSVLDIPITEKVALSVDIADGIPEFLRRTLPEGKPFDINAWMDDFAGQ